MSEVRMITILLGTDSSCCVTGAPLVYAGGSGNANHAQRRLARMIDNFDDFCLRTCVVVDEVWQRIAVCTLSPLPLRTW